MTSSSSELTISQALRKIKDLKGKIAKHCMNAGSSVTFKTKSPPAYSFVAELELVTSLVDELLELQTRVAIANAKTEVDYQGRTRSLTWCTKKLAEIKSSIGWIEGLEVRAHGVTTEHEMGGYVYGAGAHERGVVETEYTCQLPQAQKDARVAAHQAAFVALNDLVETANHRTNV